MTTYVVFLRGINVGGKNKIPMADLRQFLQEEGFSGVTTYIQSGNVILRSHLDAATLGKTIETMLSKKFKLDSTIIKVLALTRDQFQAAVDSRPKGFGDQPGTYHSDAIFLMGIDVDQAMTVFNPREGVDTVWPGNGVIYSQRISALRTKSRLGKIIGTVPYQSMTIRSWNTTKKLLELLQAAEQK